MFDRLKLNPVSEYSCKLEFIHLDKSSSSSAFNVDEDIIVRLYIPRCAAVTDLNILIRTDGENEAITTASGAWKEGGQEFECFEFFIARGTLKSNLYFAEIICKSKGNISSVVDEFGKIKLKTEPKTKKYLQITVTDSKFLLPKSKFGGIIYHIFVDRFNKTSDFIPPIGGNQVLGEWNTIPEIPDYPGAPIKNNTFFGGTLRGIEERLDYLYSLGVTIIYLSPIMRSPSNHRYDISDYMEVDPSIGGEMALVSLIRAARERGIGLLIDGVFNHTGSDSKYFNKFSNYDTVGAYQSRLSPYFSWYNFYDFPDKYECWWGIDILPRIDPSIHSCREYFVGEGGVVEKYAKLGIDGMRLDVVDELPSDFVKDIKRVLFNNGATLLYGEVWEDASNKIAYGKRKSYYLGSELDGVMNYPLREGIIDYIRNGHTDKLMYALCEVYINAPKNVADMQMNLLGSHDTVRILTELSENPLEANRSIEARLLGERRLMAAYTLICSLPGTPCIYYGDEVGMEGGSDPLNRMPYPWGRENKNILSHYRKVGNIRRSSVTLARGKFEIIELSSELFIFKRNLDDEVLVTVMNNSLEDITVHFSEEVRACLATEEIFSKRLSPLEAEIFKTKKKNKIRIVKD